MIHPFKPEPPDTAGVLSWVHIGDLHMTRAGEQNHLDLQAIVEEVNTTFSGSVSFIYLPGDVADDGSTAAYYYCVKNKHFAVELFCGITPLLARPTAEALRGIYRGSGGRRGACRPSHTSGKLLHGAVVAWRAQKR